MTVPATGPLPPMSPRVSPPAPAPAAAPAAAPAGTPTSGAARPATPGTDWLVMVRGEHRAIDAAFQRLLGASDPVSRMRALGALADAIGRHALQEETVLYPALVRGGFTAEPQQFYADHAQVKVLLGELEVMAPDATDWDGRVRSLRRLVAQHVVDEETGLYPKFRYALSPEQNAWLAARYQATGAKYTPG
jgi:hemerythrin superfamily protein